MGFRRNVICGRCFFVKYLAFSISLKWCPTWAILPLCFALEIAYPQKTLMMKKIGVSFCKHLLVLAVKLQGPRHEWKHLCNYYIKTMDFFSGRKIILYGKPFERPLFERATDFCRRPPARSLEEVRNYCDFLTLLKNDVYCDVQWKLYSPWEQLIFLLREPGS